MDTNLEGKRTSYSSGWLRLAGHPATVRRATMTAFVVGSLQVAINQGPAIIFGHLSRSNVIQIGLTIFVPYAVSTISSVSTRKELKQKR